MKELAGWTRPAQGAELLHHRVRARLRRALRITLAALVPLSFVAPLAFEDGATRADAAVVDPFTVGTNDHWFLFETDAELDADMDAMVAAGVKWLRVTLDWPSVQPTARDKWNWSHQDRVVREANERGIKIMWLAAYSPKWARPAGYGLHTPPNNPDDFANFVREAARRYAPQGVHHYEIWNEPNLGQWWQPAADPARYTTLLKKAYTAIKGVDPNSYIITGGLAPGSDTSINRSMKTFIEQMYANGAKGYFDAVGIHPYSFPWAPQFAANWNPFYMAPQYHKILTANGDGAKPLWATEVAFPTGTGTDRVSEATQADMLESLIVGWDSFSFGGPLFWHNIRDRGPDPVDLEQNWGLLRYDRSPKPSFVRLQQLLRSAQDVKADPGPQSAVIRWKAPANPSSPITGWRVVANPGAVTVEVAPDARTATLSLTDFTPYFVTVQPIHAAGPGIVSKRSNAVVPGAPVVLPAVGQVLEPDSGTNTTVRVPVHLTAPSSRDVVVDYQALSWAPTFNAHVPNDYTPRTGTLTIPAGSVVGHVSITVKGDNVVEPGGDQFLVVFSNPRNGTLGGFGGIGVGVIVDDAGG